MAFNLQAAVDAAVNAAMSAAVREAQAPLNATIAQQAATIADLTAKLAAATAPAPAPVPAQPRGWLLTAANTGLAGVGVGRSTLPLYTGPAKPAAGTIILMKRITLPELDLSNGNITLDRCWVCPSDAAGRSSIIFGYDPNFGDYRQNGPVTIQDCDIDASAVTNTTVYGQCAFRGAGNVLRCNIWGMGSGVAIFGHPNQPTVLIEGNYVHDLRGGLSGPTQQQSHNESATIRWFPGTSCIFRNNRLQSRTGSESASMFIEAIAGPINHVLLEGNEFNVSSGWVMALEPYTYGYGTDMKAINNRLVKASYGYAYVNGGPGWAEWTDNYALDAAAPDYRGAAVARP